MVAKFFRILISTLAFLVHSAALAQTVSNVTASQEGNELIISYILKADSLCEVALFVSLHSVGSWIGPLRYVSGDVGKNISEGQKAIRWQVLKEQHQLVGNNIQFRVLVYEKKWYEPEMVFVQGGTFLMGSNDASDYERPAHLVTLSDFSISKYEVTQAQWKAVMGFNPSAFGGCDNCPVDHITWYEAQSFISRLNQLTGKSYRMSTEAEWEFAARGGVKSQNYKYSGSNVLDSLVLDSDKIECQGNPVGIRKPNELGIYDMTGNASEWCSDWYGPFSNSHQTNPKGPISGKNRVLRGSGYGNSRDQYLLVNRVASEPDVRTCRKSFRLVLSDIP
jgi:formylglycine-generating enzyme required for sulfatase activity